MMLSISTLSMTMKTIHLPSFAEYSAGQTGMPETSKDGNKEWQSLADKELEMSLEKPHNPCSTMQGSYQQSLQYKLWKKRKRGMRLNGPEVWTQLHQAGSENPDQLQLPPLRRHRQNLSAS
jgi:hypothetical protein